MTHRPITPFVAAFAALALALLAGCAEAPQAPPPAPTTIHMAPGAGPQRVQPDPIAVLPPGDAATAAATERAVVTVLREVCLPGLDGRRPVAELAAAVGARAVPDPWQGRKFFADSKATAWSLPATPRAFFWMSSLDSAPRLLECVVLSYDGRRELIAQAALDAVLAFARAQGFGAPKYAVKPLAALEEDGYVEVFWRAREFALSISLDLTNPADTGLRVGVSAWRLDAAAR